MTKNILLTNLAVDLITIDYINQRVIVDYSLQDVDKKVWQTDNAVFWVTVPVVDPVPVNWLQLPASYVPTLLSLQSDAVAALASKFLV